MTNIAAWAKNGSDYEGLLAFVERPRFLMVDRPILIHASQTGARSPCHCCGSERAHVVETIPHIQLLIDRYKGTRRLRSEASDPEAWDAFAARTEAERVFMPLRCYAEQLPLVLDNKHKVVAMFGGARSGKSQTLVEWLIDGIMVYGGRGAAFWWVSPTREMTQIAVRKFCIGERTDRHARPVLPPQLVLSYPKHERMADQTIRLIDGSKIFLKYGGRDGDNLKGNSAVRVAMDEACAMPHVENYQVLLDRVTDSGGQIGIASTPVAGNWAKEAVADKGVTPDAAADLERKGERVDIISVEMSAYRNPFQDPEEIDRRVKAGGGPEDPKVRREVFGEWVGNGNILWSSFSEKKHLISGPWRDVGGYGLVNITAKVISRFFPHAEKLDSFIGLDLNIIPMSGIVVQIGCPQYADQNDPENWVLFCMDEVVTVKKNAWQYAEFLATQAGSFGRNRPPNYFAGTPIFMDSSSCRPNPVAAHMGGNTDQASTPQKILQQLGFPAEPTHYSEKGKPVNPSKLDSVSLIHRLMQTESKCPRSERTWPRFLVHAERCQYLIRSLRSQEADARGKPVKEPGKASDKLTGPTDAMMYAAWPIFWQHTLYRSEAPKGPRITFR